jgi:hypothetical protein
MRVKIRCVTWNFITAECRNGFVRIADANNVARFIYLRWICIVTINQLAGEGNDTRLKCGCVYHLAKL